MESKRVGPSVQPIEKLKADKENLYLFAKETPAGLLLAAFCAFVKRTANLLSSRSLKSVQGILYQEGIKADLAVLRDLLLQLSKMDVSDHVPYVQQLSSAWHRLLKVIHVMELLERKESDFLKKVKETLSQIRSYPPSSDHPLGFYLEQSPGPQWLPFPFIEILHQLHEEAAVKQKTGYLQQWCEILELLISKKE
jgi:hypothetical protein